MAVGPSPFPGQDLRLVVEGAILAEGHLLTAGERCVLLAILELREPALELYARLTSRQPRPFRVGELQYPGDVPGQLAELADAGLVQRNVPDDRCLPAFGAEELKAACRRLGLPARGSRAQLEERLAGKRWVDEPVVIVGHLGLLRRCEVLFFQTPHLSRQDLVLDRIGVVKWPSYAPTGGPGLFRRRAALLAWERARKREWREGDVERLLAAGPGQGVLDPWRYAVEARVLALEAAPPVERAAGLRALLDGGAGVRVPLARALEQAGDRADALAVVLGGRDARTGEGLACARTARRLARAVGVRLPPSVELKEAPVRSVRVPGGGVAGGGARPAWPTREGAMVSIEAAVIDWLAGLGRRAIHGEAQPWIALYALVFADLYFLPVPGMLPTRFRSGPVDVGTPGFYTRRRAAVDERLARVSAFGSLDYVIGYDGSRLAGLTNLAGAVFLAEHAPANMVHCVLRRLAEEGWSASPGLPDLFVPEGPPQRLEEALRGLDSLPAKLPKTAFLAEIKGPTDTLRDEQRLWIDRFLQNGIHVELWELTPKLLM